MRFPPVLLFLLGLTALRLAFVGQLELSPDEAYYQMWSERLDWAYFSKGPGVALAIRAGTELFGVNEFGVRFLAPMLALGTSLLLWALARRMFGAGAAAWTVLALNLTPLFTAGSLLMTIDPLSVFFWAAGMLAVWRAVMSGGSPANIGWWALAGLAVGLGLLCKYTNAAEWLSFLVALAWVPRWRREFRRAGVYLAFLVTAACALPALWWMREHDWVTIGHLGARGGFEESFQLAKAPSEFGKWLVGLVGVYGPLVFLAMVIALIRPFDRVLWKFGEGTTEDDHARFLLAFTLPLLIGYGLLAFKTAGEPNWTAPAFLSLGVWAGGFWHGVAARSRGARVFALLALLTSAAVSLFALNTDLARMAGAPLSYHKEPTARLYGWRTMAEGVAETRRMAEAETGAPVFLIAAKYGTAAELNFYLPADVRRVDRPGHPAVYLPESQSFENQFSFWPSYAELPLSADTSVLPGDDAKMTAEAEFAGVGANPYAGRSALFIVEGDRATRPPSSVESGFERVESAGRYEVRRRGREVRVFQVFWCENYRGAEL